MLFKWEIEIYDDRPRINVKTPNFQKDFFCHKEQNFKGCCSKNKYIVFFLRQVRGYKSSHIPLGHIQ